MDTTTFDPANPNKKLVRMVLHQAFGTDYMGVKDVYSEAWCLRDMELPAWNALKAHLLEHKLIEESGEPGYYKITRKGEAVNGGEDYGPGADEGGDE